MAISGARRLAEEHEKQHHLLAPWAGRSGPLGLPRACVASIDSLSTIARGQLVERISTLGAPKMAEVCRALNVTVEC